MIVDPIETLHAELVKDTIPGKILPQSAFRNLVDPFNDLLFIFLEYTINGFSEYYRRNPCNHESISTVTIQHYLEGFLIDKSENSSRHLKNPTNAAKTIAVLPEKAFPDIPHYMRAALPSTIIGSRSRAPFTILDGGRGCGKTQTAMNIAAAGDVVIYALWPNVAGQTVYKPFEIFSECFRQAVAADRSAYDRWFASRQGSEGKNSIASIQAFLAHAGLPPIVERANRTRAAACYGGSSSATAADPATTSAAASAAAFAVSAGGAGAGGGVGAGAGAPAAAAATAAAVAACVQHDDCFAPRPRLSAGPAGVAMGPLLPGRAIGRWVPGAGGAGVAMGPQPPGAWVGWGPQLRGAGPAMGPLLPGAGQAMGRWVPGAGVVMGPQLPAASPASTVPAPASTVPAPAGWATWLLLEAVASKSRYRLATWENPEAVDKVMAGFEAKPKPSPPVEAAGGSHGAAAAANCAATAGAAAASAATAGAGAESAATAAGVVFFLDEVSAEGLDGDRLQFTRNLLCNLVKHTVISGTSATAANLVPAADCTGTDSWCQVRFVHPKLDVPSLERVVKAIPAGKVRPDLRARLLRLLPAFRLRPRIFGIAVEMAQAVKDVGNFLPCLLAKIAVQVYSHPAHDVWAMGGQLPRSVDPLLSGPSVGTALVGVSWFDPAVLVDSDRKPVNATTDPGAPMCGDIAWLIRQGNGLFQLTGGREREGPPLPFEDLRASFTSVQVDCCYEPLVSLAMVSMLAGDSKQAALPSPRALRFIASGEEMERQVFRAITLAAYRCFTNQSAGVPSAAHGTHTPRPATALAACMAEYLASRGTAHPITFTVGDAPDPKSQQAKKSKSKPAAVSDSMPHDGTATPPLLPWVVLPHVPMSDVPSFELAARLNGLFGSWPGLLNGSAHPIAVLEPATALEPFDMSIFGWEAAAGAAPRRVRVSVEVKAVTSFTAHAVATALTEKISSLFDTLAELGRGEVSQERWLILLVVRSLKRFVDEPLAVQLPFRPGVDGPVIDGWLLSFQPLGSSADTELLPFMWHQAGSSLRQLADIAALAADVTGGRDADATAAGGAR